VLDVNHVASVLRALVEPYEHVLLNEVPPFDDLNPTAENLARIVAEGLASRLDDGRVRVARVDVWENDSCCATFHR
jgi:6-pyruvoyltetrahydropterin/6-carboxytetrahydropterin synthase